MGSSNQIITRRTLLPVVLLAGIIAGCSAESAPGPVAVEPFKMGKPDVVLLITGGTDGRLEICDCPSSMTAGLARRSGLFISYRAAFPDRCLAIDTGDFFYFDPEDNRSEFVLKGYRKMGYDMAVLGEQEWAVGLERLRKMLDPGGGRAGHADEPRIIAPGGLNFISNMGNSRHDGQLLQVFTVNGLWKDRLAVFADLAEEAMRFVPAERREGVGQLMHGLADVMEPYRKQGYALVMIAHGDQEHANAYAKEGCADLIIRGHTSRTELEVNREFKTPIVQVGSSEYVGVVALKIADGKITALEYRPELVDERWPIDWRMVKIFKDFLKQAKNSTAAATTQPAAPSH